MNRYELVSKFKYRNMFNFECSTHWPPIRSYNGNCWTILAFSSANANSVRKLPHSLHFWNVLIFRMRIYLIAFLSHDRFETVWLRRMHRQRSELSCTTKHGVVECNKFTHFMILMHRRHSPKRISCSNLSSIFFLATAAAAVHLISLFDARCKMCNRSEQKRIRRTLLSREKSISFSTSVYCYSCCWRRRRWQRRQVWLLLTHINIRIWYASDDVVFASHLSADENRIEWQMISEKCDICTKRIHA